MSLQTHHIKDCDEVVWYLFICQGTSTRRTNQPFESSCYLSNHSKVREAISVCQPQRKLLWIQQT